MPSWERIADARIREWQRRPEEDRKRPNQSAPVAPLELQIVNEIRGLLEQARETDDGVRAEELRRRAEGLKTRLFILLENSGRPLTAKHYAELLGGRDP